MRLVIALLAALFTAASSFAQTGPYPSRPVKVIIPFGPGGISDTVARLLAQFSEKKFGQPFVAENRPGAGTLIGTDAVVKAAPDGYTLLFTPNSFVNQEILNPAWTVKMDRDFTIISQFAGSAIAIAVSNSVPIRNLQELVEYSRANPGKLNQAQAGSVSIDLEILKHRLKMGPMESIMYKGGVPSVQALVAGESHLYGASVLDVAQLDKAGKLKVILYGDRERHPLLPNAPTPREVNMGIDDYNAAFSFYSIGPANLPADIVAKLNQAAIEFVDSPAFIETAVNKFGLTPYRTSPREATASAQATYRKFSEAKAAGLVR